MLSRSNAPAALRAARLAVLLPLMAAALVACGKKSDDKASQAAVSVDGTEITVHEINQQLANQPGLRPDQAEAASRQVLESLIDQQLAVAKAEDLKLDRDPTVVQEVEAARKTILAREYLKRAASSGVTPPTADEVRKYFDNTPNLFSQRRIYALVEFTVPCTQAQREDLIAKLQTVHTPKEYGDLIQAAGLKFAAHESNEVPERMAMQIVDGLAKTPDGSALFVRANDGFKALLVVASKTQPYTFDQAKGAIEQFLTVQSKREFVQKELKNLRAAAKIEYIGKFAQKPASGASAASSPQVPAAEPVAAAASDAASAASGIDANAMAKGLSGLK